MAKKNTNKIEIIPLSQDKSRALSLLKILIKKFPFNSKDKYFGTIFHDLLYNSLDTEMMKILCDQFERKGHLNDNLMNQSEIQTISNLIRTRSISHDQIGILFDAIIKNGLCKINPNQDNNYYYETPAFILFRDFLTILHAFILPNGSTWRNQISDIFNDDASFYNLFYVNVKGIDPHWLSDTKRLV